MADKLKVEDKNEVSFVNKAGDFIAKNKVLLMVCAIAVVVIVVLSVVISSASNSSKDKAMIRVDALETRYSAFATLPETDAQYNSTFDALVSDLEKEVKKDSYASVKSAYILGETYYTKNDYSSAYDWFMKAFELNSKIYLAPICLINAAVCKEKTNDTNAAFELYQKASDYEEVKAQALFNVARIYFQQGKMDLAKATFQSVADIAGQSEYKALAQNILTTM